MMSLACAAAVVYMAGYAVATAFVEQGGDSGKFLSDAIYPLPLALAIVIGAVAARRAEGRMRLFWYAVLASWVINFAAELVWSWIELIQGREVPYPSPADWLWLAGYPPALAALCIGFWKGSSLRVSRAILDGSVLAAAVGYVGYRVLIEPQLGDGGGTGILVSSGYPIGDVLIITLLGSIAFAHRKLPLPVALVGLGFTSAAIGDIGYTYMESVNSYSSGGWLDLFWQGEFVLFCLAAVAGLRTPRMAEERRVALDPGVVPVLLGGAVTVAFIAVEGADGDLRTGGAAVLVYVVCAVVLRLLLTSREKDEVARALETALEEQERLAITDQLTGLHNRRFFDEALRLEAERTLRTDRSLGLLVFDLDHFKSVNDRHGHPAGDRVLRETAGRLQDCVRPSDVVARHGGEEFAMLLPETDPEVLLELGERCRRAVAERPFDVGSGDPIRVTISVGGATLPRDAGEVGTLVRAADRALYRAKGRGRDRVEIGADAADDTSAPLADPGGALALLQSLAESLQPEATGDDHALETARLAGLLAERLGLDPDATWRCVAAARLHDIGKLRVPVSVLEKPGPLTEAEWRLVRAHPAAGAEIIRLRPELGEVARAVREHHERWDGGGYPDGKAGEEICIEARVIAVCDAWAAMRSDRPYRPALSLEDARDELITEAGRQFDPLVVAAFLELLRERAPAAWGRATPLP